MKRFHFAIKAIDDEMLRTIGKVARNAVDSGHDPIYAVSCQKAKNLKEAVKILEEHIRNINI